SLSSNLLKHSQIKQDDLINNITTKINSKLKVFENKKRYDDILNTDNNSTRFNISNKININNTNELRSMRSSFK
ncbi:hypothetical protein U2063_15410, partial [Listeria monocytogenes]|uniref:hypothetical protein n=1 Tax=Listeria monocytogenes TaxID=1639 RepID=UPI002FDC3586